MKTTGEENNRNIGMALVCECVFVELWVGAITMTSVCIKLHIIVIRILINITFGFSVTANEQSFVFSPSLFLSLGGSLFYCVIIFIIQKYDLTCVIVYKYNMYVRGVGTRIESHMYCTGVRYYATQIVDNILLATYTWRRIILCLLHNTQYYRFKWI